MGIAINQSKADVGHHFNFIDGPLHNLRKTIQRMNGSAIPDVATCSLSVFFYFFISGDILFSIMVYSGGVILNSVRDLRKMSKTVDILIL